MGEKIIKCECCGEEIREDDSFVDEDTHDILCSECYFRDDGLVDELRDYGDR